MSRLGLSGIEVILECESIDVRILIDQLDRIKKID